MFDFFYFLKKKKKKKELSNKAHPPENP